MSVWHSGPVSGSGTSSEPQTQSLESEAQSQSGPRAPGQASQEPMAARWPLTLLCPGRWASGPLPVSQQKLHFQWAMGLWQRAGTTRLLSATASLRCRLKALASPCQWQASVPWAGRGCAVGLKPMPASGPESWRSASGWGRMPLPVGPHRLVDVTTGMLQRHGDVIRKWLPVEETTSSPA